MMSANHTMAGERHRVGFPVVDYVAGLDRRLRGCLRALPAHAYRARPTHRHCHAGCRACHHGTADHRSGHDRRAQQARRHQGIQRQPAFRHLRDRRRLDRDDGEHACPSGRHARRNRHGRSRRRCEAAELGRASRPRRRVRAAAAPGLRRRLGGALGGCSVGGRRAGVAGAGYRRNSRSSPSGVARGLAAGAKDCRARPDAARSRRRVQTGERRTDGRSAAAAARPAQHRNAEFAWLLGRRRSTNSSLPARSACATSERRRCSAAAAAPARLSASG